MAPRVKYYICSSLDDRVCIILSITSGSHVRLLQSSETVSLCLQGFGEIAFCAVAASQQVRGFGTRLMNHTKAFARDRDNLTHFLTYADNNAVGYFTKQVWILPIVTTQHGWQQSTASC